MTSRGAVNRRKADETKKGDSQVTPGLPEQGSEHDPTARSSHEPELPIADDTGDESEGPPGIAEESSDDESITLDYRDFEDARSDDDDEPDNHALNYEEEIFQALGLEYVEPTARNTDVREVSKPVLQD